MVKVNPIRRDDAAQVIERLTDLISRGSLSSRIFEDCLALINSQAAKIAELEQRIRKLTAQGAVE